MNLDHNKALLAAALAVLLFAVTVPPGALVMFGPFSVLLNLGLGVYFLFRRG